MPESGNPRKERENDELTRRQWLLRLGESVALFGFSGVAGAENLQAAPAFKPGEAGAALPPGLYEPSSDHLSHALTLDDPLHPIPPGSETEYVRARSGPYQPQFFSSSEFETVRRIVALMLGEASGASSAGAIGQSGVVDEVAEWLDLTVSSSAAVREAARRLAPEHRNLAVHYYGAAAVEEVEKNDAQKTCRDGLLWLAEASGEDGFLSLTLDRQIVLLEKISDARPDKTTENAGIRFFALIKAGVIRGFYTSRPGLKELDYRGNAFYAESPGCPGSSH